MTKQARLSLIKRIASQSGIGSNDSFGLLAPSSFDVADERSALTTSLGDDTVSPNSFEVNFLQDLIFEGGQE